MKNNKKNKPVQIYTRLAPTKVMKEYLATLPEDVRAELYLQTNLDVAIHSGAEKRIGYLCAAYYHLYSIMSLISTDMGILFDDWGIWLKGLKPAMTNVEQAGIKLIRTFHDLMGGAPDRYYAMDVDSLTKKFFRWEGIPDTWAPGQPLRIDTVQDKTGKDETLVIDNDNEYYRITPIDDDANVPGTCWRVAKMLDDERAEMIKRIYKSEGAAKTAAAKLAKANPGTTYIIYEQRNRLRFRPVDYRRMKKESE